MTSSRFTFALIYTVALLIARPLWAGTLDEAPFRIVVPDAGWQVQDANAQSMGEDVFLVASISNTNSALKSVVIKNILRKPAASSLEELCAGINDSFANPIVKKIAETDTTFLGYKAKIFAYQVTQGGQTTYNETTVFVAEGKGWSIACTGRPDQKEEIKKMLGFYQKKAG